MIPGPITCRWDPKSFLRARSAFRMCLAAGLMLVLPDWAGECAAVVIAAWSGGKENGIYVT